MPYIKLADRYGIDCGADFPQNCGELNYSITREIHRYIHEHNLCYPTLNEVIGVLECCKLEIYRIIAAKYEDEKRKLNGPVSELDKE